MAVTVFLYGSLPNPMWLSLIWTNEKLPVPARPASWPKARDERMPPPAVHRSPGACPRHAFQEPATIHPVALVIAFALIRHYRDSPCANFGADFDPGRTLRERRRPLALDTPEWPRQMTWERNFARAVMEAASPSDGP